MFNIDGFRSKMEHDGKRNNKNVEIICYYCGGKNWQRWQRVRTKLKKNDNFFCSKKCSSHYLAYEVNSDRKYGKESAKFAFDKKKGTWYAYWFEKGNKRHNTSKSRWLWEMNHGEVPDGYWVTYKDRNPSNCVLENLELIKKGERMSEALMGHKHSLETRQKISMAHTGKSKWSGFVTDQRYPGLSKRRKYEVKERDGFICQICKDDLYNTKKSIVHHIDGSKTNHEMENLILVCKKCHGMIHSKQDVSSQILAFRSMLG